MRKLCLLNLCFQARDSQEFCGVLIRSNSKMFVETWSWLKMGHESERVKTVVPGFWSKMPPRIFCRKLKFDVFGPLKSEDSRFRILIRAPTPEHQKSGPAIFTVQDSWTFWSAVFLPWVRDFICGSREPWLPGPSWPQDFFKIMQFSGNFKGKPVFWDFLGPEPPLASKLRCPLTKILGPPLDLSPNERR